LTTETYSYDDVGNLLQKTDGNGTTVFNYSDIYQLIETVHPDQSSVTFEYDANGNITLMVDPEGSTSYTYDNRNRCLSETRIFGDEPYAIGYNYDAASRLVSITYPDKSVITYEYDALNRLVNIQGYAQFTYNDNSLLASMAFGNGVVTSYQYNARDSPISIHAQKNDPLLTMNYQYDPVGNITQLEFDRNQGQNWVQSTKMFQFDWLDRLVSAQDEYGALTYSYDPVGNRILQNELTFTYNNMNELLSISDGCTFTYDEMGNSLTKARGVDVWTYIYDKQNRLVRVENEQQVVALYTYDGSGKRTQKTEWIGSLQEYQTIIYIYFGTNILYEKNMDTEQEATYVYGSTGRIAKTVGELRNYYHVDHLGSTRLVTSENGNTLTDVEYGAFGDQINSTAERYTYNGKELDETHLYYYGARYYDPEIGRFTTRDTAMGNYKYPQSLNRYSYCRNNPLSYVDPDGRIEKKFVKEGSSCAGTPTEYMHFFLSLGTNKGTLDLYVLKTADLSKVMISGLISFTVMKTVGKEGDVEDIVNFALNRSLSRSPNVFTISVEGIENANVNFIVPEGTYIPVKGASIDNDQINILWQLNEAEAGDMLYVYFYFLVSASGEAQIVVIITTHAVDPNTTWEDLTEDMEMKKAQSVVIPAGDAPGSGSNSDPEII
jgi:RHS repeat-associated protein